jgi:hypothetical protein
LGGVWSGGGRRPAWQPSFLTLSSFLGGPPLSVATEMALYFTTETQGTLRKPLKNFRELRVSVVIYLQQHTSGRLSI